jgi:hypothetical protein
MNSNSPGRFAVGVVSLGGSLFGISFTRDAPSFAGIKADAPGATNRVSFRRFALRLKLVEKASRDFLGFAKFIDSE